MTDRLQSPEPPARIWPTLRTKVEGGYSYDRLYLRGYGGAAGGLVTPYVPVVGDLIHLNDEERGPGTYRVVERAWGHSAYGSADWPLAQIRPNSGPIVDLIVEPAAGPFIDEVYTPEEEDEEDEDE